MKKIISNNQSGSALIIGIIALGLAITAFFFTQKRGLNLLSDIDSTILNYQQEGKLLELRSLLTNVNICEGSLKNLYLDRETPFQLKNSSNQIVDLNPVKSEIQLKQLILKPLDPVVGEFSNGTIHVTLAVHHQGEVYEKHHVIPFNFFVNPSTKQIRECLGEKTEESDELFRTTIASKRAAICKDALKGSINQQGKCQWPW